VKAKGSQERKQFFFEKKNQKTFTPWHAVSVLPSETGCREQQTKAFWFFFSRENCFLR
jgi:hypothetical protein